MRSLPSVRALAVVLSLAVALPVSAQSDALKRARGLLDDLEEAQAIEVLEAALADSSLSDGERADALCLVGMARVNLFEFERARESFQEALAVKPGVTLPVGASPKAQRLFDEVKASAPKKKKKEPPAAVAKAPEPEKKKAEPAPEPKAEPAAEPQSEPAAAPQPAPEGATATAAAPTGGRTWMTPAAYVAGGTGALALVGGLVFGISANSSQQAAVAAPDAATARAELDGAFAAAGAANALYIGSALLGAAGVTLWLLDRPASPAAAPAASPPSSSDADDPTFGALVPGFRF